MMDSRTSAGNENKNCYMNVQLAKGRLPIEEGKEYTWLVEVKIRSWSGTSGAHIYARPSVGHATLDKLSDVGATTLQIEKGGTFRSIVTSKADFSSLTQDTRGYFYIPTGCYAEFDVRISLYEGKYQGSYKPYILTNDNIASNTQKIYYRNKQNGAPAAPTV